MIWSKCHATSGSNTSFQCRDAFRNPFHPSAVTGRCRNYLARSQLLPAPVCLLGSALATKKFLGQKSIQTSSLWETVCLSGKSINIYIYNTYIFETKCCTHIFRPMISVKSGSSHLEDHLPSTNLGKAPYKIPAGPGTLVRLALWAPANRHRGFKKLNMELVWISMN